MSRNTRRMIERLDPFSLPQRGADRLAWSPPAPKVQERDDAPRAPQPPGQRKSKKRRRKESAP